ncbi:patatin-like phospholipase family protein [Tenacibaculum sp. UWU-22]|uniref:patatin-like phospholipase family protein n=1 Tax=Tenacibaculum sp. UWU-22 TaxID=3234187 RepID=UPI0034DAEC3D
MKRKLLLIFWCIPLLLLAQKQPKVGLVLSGGGAKGFAYIGVLKELEKANIQIDYIGGTSMGAIIGGLYAAGYSAEQIEKIILKTDFSSIIQDKIPRSAKPFFDKENAEKHAISLPIRNNIIGLPRGVSKGQNILNFLTELLAPVDSITDFSKLPIPFFCVSTNIENGEKVILEKGSLPLALRASGSFPTLLNPVEINGQLLIDGGIANNFPVDEMKKKGVDIIIGVDTQGKLIKRKKLTSIVSILNQIINYQMYQKSDLQKKLVNIYIRPNVSEYSVVDFEKETAILNQGVKAAKPMIPVFDSIAKLQINKKPRPKIVLKNKLFLLDRIVVNGNKNYTKNYILGKLQLKEGDSISYKILAEKINNLTATNNFNRIDYNFTSSFKGKKLTLKVKESEVNSFLRIGLHYDLLYESGVLLNYTHKHFLFKNDVFSVDAIVGDKVRGDLNFFVDNGFGWSFGVKSRYNNFSAFYPFNSNSINKINIRYQDFTNTFYTQTAFDRKFALGLGIEYKHIQATSENLITNSNNNKTTFDDSGYLNVISYLKLDTYDKIYFPTKGFYGQATFRWYLASNRNDKIKTLVPNAEKFNQFSQINGKIGVAIPVWKHFTFQYISEAGLTLGEEASQVFDFRLGGYNQNYINTFVPLYGYQIGTLSEQSFLKSEFNFRYAFAKKNYLSFIANYARIENNIFNNLALFDNIKSGYALGYSLDTFLGPIELKYSWSPDTSNHYWLFNLGFWF